MEVKAGAILGIQDEGHDARLGEESLDGVLKAFFGGDSDESGNDESVIEAIGRLAGEKPAVLLAEVDDMLRDRRVGIRGHRQGLAPDERNPPGIGRARQRADLGGVGRRGSSERRILHRHGHRPRFHEIAL